MMKKTPPSNLNVACCQALACLAAERSLMAKVPPMVPPMPEKVSPPTIHMIKPQMARQIRIASPMVALLQGAPAKILTPPLCTPQLGAPQEGYTPSRAGAPHPHQGTFPVRPGRAFDRVYKHKDPPPSEVKMSLRAQGPRGLEHLGRRGPIQA